jgi:hypothetical protein
MLKLRYLPFWIFGFDYNFTSMSFSQFSADFDGPALSGKQTLRHRPGMLRKMNIS